MGSPITLSTALEQSDGQAASGSTGPATGGVGTDSQNYLTVDDFLSSGTAKKSTDNATGFSNAINRAASENRALYVPDKTYYINSGFTFDKSIRMLGEGTFALPPGDDAFDQMVTVTADDVVMEGVTWDASEASSNFSSGRGETLRWTGDNAKAHDVTAVGLDGNGSNVTCCFVPYSKNGTFLNCTARKATFAGFRCVPGAGTLRLLGCESFDHATRGFMASARNFIDDSPQLASSANSGDSSIDVENYVPNFGDIIGIRDSDADDLFYVAGVTDQGGGVFTVSLEDPDGSPANLSSGYSSGKDITYNEGGLIIEDAVVGEPSGNATSFSTSPSGIVLDPEPQVLKMLYVGAPRLKASGTSIKVAYAESAVIHGASGDVDPNAASTFGFSSENEWQTRRFLRNLHISDCRLTGRAIFDAQERITVRDTRLENGPRYIDKGATDGDYEYNARVRTPGEAIFDNVSFFGATKEAVRLQGDSTGEKQKLRLKSPRFHQDAEGAEPVQIVGGVKGDVEVNGSQASGTSTVDIRTGNRSWVKLTEGEIIAFAGHSQEYKVQSSLRVPPNSTGAIDIDPALQQGVSDSESVGGQGKMWPGRVRVSDPEFRGGTRRITNKFEFEDYVDHQMGREHVPFFHSGDLETIASYHDSGGTEINHGRLHWRTGAGATSTASSGAAFGQDSSGRYYLEITGSDGLGRKVSVKDCERFVLDGEVVEGAEARPYIILYDENGNEITDSDAAVALGARNIITKSSYGGSFSASGNRDLPLYFEITEDAAVMEVGYRNLGGDSKLYSFSIHALQAARHVDSWAEGSMGDYPQAKEEPAQWGGHSGEGVWVLHESPSASDVVAWIAQPSSTIPIEDETVDVEDNGNSVLTNPEVLNFGDGLDATDRGDGEAKIDMGTLWTVEEGDGESDAVEQGERVIVSGGTDLNTEMTQNDGPIEIEVRHDNTSSTSGQDATGLAAIDEVQVDGRGHVTDISKRDLSENVDDRVNTLLADGSDITLSYDDANDTLTISHDDTSSATGADTSGLVMPHDIDVDGHGHVTNVSVRGFAEDVDDRVNTLLEGGSNITLSYDDAGNDLTIDASTGSGYSDEDAQDAVATALTGGTDLAITYDDGSDTITVRHDDTSSATSKDATGISVIDEVLVDGRGHVTGLSKRSLSEDVQDQTGSILLRPLNYNDTGEEVGVKGQNFHSVIDDTGTELSDNDVWEFDPGNFLGVIWVFDSDREVALIVYDSSHEVISEVADLGGNVETNIGSLGGTTGTNGALTVGVKSSDQNIQIENRLGSSRAIVVVAALSTQNPTNRNSY